MKKKSIYWLILAASVVGLASCGNYVKEGGGSSSSDTGLIETTVDIDSVGCGFIVNPEQSGQTVDYTKYTSLNSLSIASKYFLVFEFGFSPRGNTGGTAILNSEITFPALTIFDAFSQEVDSGASQTPVSYKDPTTNEQMKKVTASFKVPETAGKTKKELIVFSIAPKTTGNSHISLNFTSTSLLLAGDGSSGKTTAITIDSYQIDAPTLSYSGRLQWNHVKYANYYEIFVNGDVLLKNGEKYKQQIDDSTAIGATVSFSDFASFGISGNDIGFKIQAFSSEAGYEPSSYSNEIFETI
jgi:hypothetical protein